MNTWTLNGYYQATVARQANDQDIPDVEGIFTVHDITAPLHPRTLNVIPGHIIRSTRQALDIIVNFGMFGHAYLLSGRTQDTTLRYTITL